MQKFNVVQIAYNCSNENAGTSQAIFNFDEVFHSQIISFSRDANLEFSSDACLRQFNIPYYDSPINRYSYTWSSKKKQAQQLIATADLVICHGLFRYHIDWAIGLAVKNDIPFWIIPHGSLDPYVFTYRKLSKKIWLTLKGNREFAKASAIIYSTEAEMLKARQAVSVAHSHIVHWPVAYVDTSNFADARARIRALHSIPPDAKVLLFIGRIHPSKRPIETIKVIAGCDADNLHLLMIGPDSDVLKADECIKFCKDNKISNVHLAAPVYGQAKFDYFMAADSFISLSARENFGYTVAEAMASGIPVILSPGNDLSKEINYLDCGWMLTDDTLACAISAVKEFVVTKSETLAEMGQRGQQWARTELTKEKFMANINALAEQLMKKSTKTISSLT